MKEWKRSEVCLGVRDMEIGGDAIADGAISSDENLVRLRVWKMKVELSVHDHHVVVPAAAASYALSGIRGRE